MSPPQWGRSGTAGLLASGQQQSHSSIVTGPSGVELDYLCQSVIADNQVCLLPSRSEKITARLSHPRLRYQVAGYGDAWTLDVLSPPLRARSMIRTRPPTAWLQLRAAVRIAHEGHRLPRPDPRQ